MLSVPAVPIFPKNMMMMYRQFPRIRHVSLHAVPVSLKYDDDVSTIPPNPVRESIWSRLSFTLLLQGRFFQLQNRSWVAPSPFLSP